VTQSVKLQKTWQKWGQHHAMWIDACQFYGFNVLFILSDIAPRPMQYKVRAVDVGKKKGFRFGLADFENDWQTSAVSLFPQHMEICYRISLS
jgi:hypothetical protein